MKIGLIGPNAIGKTTLAQRTNNKCVMPVVEKRNLSPKNKEQNMKKADIAAYLGMAVVGAQDIERANEMAQAYNGSKGESKNPKTDKTKSNRAKNKAALKARKKNRKR